MAGVVLTFLAGILLLMLKLIRHEKQPVLVIFSCVIWLVVALYLNYYFITK